MNAKELFENEELMEDLIEEIDDSSEETEILYAVWAVGYNKEGVSTEDDHLLGEFVDLDKAIACAEEFNLKNFLEENSILHDTTYFSIEVDTMVGYIGDDDSGTVNVDTVYHREVWLSEIGLDGEPIIALSEGDYEILEDNTLKIRKEALKGYNKNDTVNIYFEDDSNSDIMICKIVSKVIYSDGDYWHCELVF